MITQDNGNKVFDMNPKDILIDGESLDVILRHYNNISVLIRFALDNPSGWKAITEWDNLRGKPIDKNVSVKLNNTKEKGFRQDYLTDTSNVTMIPNPKNQGYYIKIELDGIKYEMNKVFPFEDDENNKAIVKITDISKSDKIMFYVKKKLDFGNLLFLEGMNGIERIVDKIYLNTDDTFHIGDEIKWKGYTTNVVYIIKDDQGRTNYVCDSVYEQPNAGNLKISPNA
jgi:hypothetical protein